MVDNNAQPLSEDNLVPIQDLTQQYLDDLFASLDKEWHSPLQFQMHVGNNCANSDTTVELDICAFFGRLQAANGIKGKYAYFDRSTYPPLQSADELSKEGNSMANLHQDLVAKSLTSGFVLVSNGNSTKNSALASRKHFPEGSSPPFFFKNLLM